VSKVVLDVSISLDGFAAGPNVRPDEPMGDGGERLHEWKFAIGPGTEVDAQVNRETEAMVGAALIGRRTFDLGVGPWGGTPWPGVASFVVTHRPEPDRHVQSGGAFAFSGLEEAVRRAREAAGEAEVRILGPSVGRQLLCLGLLDEIRLQIVPILLGSGTRLFGGCTAELIQDGEVRTGSVTHIRYRVSGGRGGGS
jgi:dihydrofolate reductase